MTARISVPTRCPWSGAEPLYLAYHDEEWGVPVHDDRHLFEMLILEGAQAGLSWWTILTRRERYREAYGGFDPQTVAGFGPEKVASMLADPGLVRNRAKLETSVGNAHAFLAVQEEHGSFDAYLWRFVGGRPIRNRRLLPSEVPAQTDESRALSKDLSRRGFRFVGPTICYAYMQAVGMVNDHLVGCFRHRQVERS